MQAGSSTGSSPRVRGKRYEPEGGLVRTGLIPACAGKTSSPESSSGPLRAHPRVCGENTARPIPIGSGEGSSPRVRGKRQAQAWQALNRRLIPACAGKTTSRTQTAGASEAHPRVCGENALSRGLIHGLEGSSPRVRGKQTHGRRPGIEPRLIPACAGKTGSTIRYRRHGWAHPRVCGENSGPGTARACGWGSSPRVRGKRSRARADSPPCRLIPACAGKTVWTRGKTS